MKKVILLGLILTACAEDPATDPNAAKAATPASTPSTSSGGSSGGGSGGGGGGSSSASTASTTTTTVTPPVVTITLNAETKTVAEGSALSFTPVSLYTGSASLTYSCFNNCPSGLSVLSNGLVSWTPSYTQSGTYYVNLQVSDGTVYDRKDFTITVSNTNRAPTLASISSQTVAENQNISFTLSGADADGDTLTYSSSALPSGATFNAATKTFSWTPGFSQSGSYPMTFTVSDGSLSASQNMTITVSNTNRAPVLAAISNQVVAETGALNFTVSASDADNDAITLSASNLPTGATFTPATGAFAWTPDCTQEGSYTVTFGATDGSLSDSKNVGITVNHTNCFQPTWTAAASLYSQSGNDAVAFIGTGTDYDGTGVTYTYVGEFECNNKDWTNSYNSATRRISVTNTFGSLNPGSHWFLFYIQDVDGSQYYRFVKITGYGGSFSVTTQDQGATYSTAGFCAGTVYQHL